MRPTRAEKVFSVFNTIGMVLFCAVCLYPFVYVLALSFNDGADAMRGGIYLWPRKFTLENYSTLFGDPRLKSSLFISVYRTVCGVILAVVLNAMYAFTISKKNLPGRKFLSWYVMIPMYFGGGIIPYYLVCQKLGLINNLLVYVIPWIYVPFYILMLRVNFVGMSEALEESAKIDGAGYCTIFFKIYFPLSMPSLATIALLCGLMHWNDWYDGTVMVSSSRMWPLQTLLLNILQGADIMSFFKSKNLAQAGSMARRSKITPESLKMCMLVITTLPIVLIYPFLQKYIVKGMMVGSIKG